MRGERRLLERCVVGDNLVLILANLWSVLQLEVLLAEMILRTRIADIDQRDLPCRPPPPTKKAQEAVAMEGCAEK